MDDLGELFEVRLLELPLVLRARSAQHGAELVRELELIRLGRESGLASQDAPERLLELAEELRVYAPYLSAPTAEMDAAVDRGEEWVGEVAYRLPAASVALVHRADEVLREVEEYARGNGHLLTLAPPAEIVAYRTWMITEVQRQRAGQAPTPWPQFAQRSGLLDGVDSAAR